MLYAGLSRWVLRRDSKVGRNVNMMISFGNAFRNQGAELLKGLNLMVDRWADGLEMKEAEMDLSVKEEVYISRTSVRYGGARLGAGFLNQYGSKPGSRGVVWGWGDVLCGRDLEMMQAADFWTILKLKEGFLR